MCYVHVATALIWAIFEIQISCTNLDFKIDTRTHTHTSYTHLIRALVYLFFSLFWNLHILLQIFVFTLCIFVTEKRKYMNKLLCNLDHSLCLFAKCVKQLFRENFCISKNIKILNCYCILLKTQCKQ